MAKILDHSLVGKLEPPEAHSGISSLSNSRAPPQASTLNNRIKPAQDSSEFNRTIKIHRSDQTLEEGVADSRLIKPSFSSFQANRMSVLFSSFLNTKRSVWTMERVERNHSSLETF